MARSTFGPVVLLGLAASGLTAAAANQTWASVSDSRLTLDYAGVTVGAGKSPLALALALAVLAGWGVLLILRGRVRRVLAWLALLGSLGVVATIVAAHWQLSDDLTPTYADWKGTIDVTFTGWYWTALIASLIAVAAAALACRHVKTWPEMGSKYDAPGAAHSPVEPETPLEIWKAIDEGRDPTL